MSHLKITTSHAKAQQPALTRIAFGDALMETNYELFCVEAGGSVTQAVETASDLADGLTQLLMRQHQAVNFGENIYTAETRALAFISQAVWALARSAKEAMRQQAEQPEDSQ